MRPNIISTALAIIASAAPVLGAPEVGIIGIILGVGGAVLLGNLSTDYAPIITLPPILLAFGFAAAVGIFFGFYPAQKASRLSPIDALRHE